MIFFVTPIYRMVLPPTYQSTVIVYGTLGKNFMPIALKMAELLQFPYHYPLGGNILEKNQIFFCCTQISMWLYILRHLVKELVNLSQYISPNRYLKISKSPYNRKKIFSRNIVMWVLYQDARRCLIQCKRNQRNPTLWC